jgi:hypothetical protein
MFLNYNYFSINFSRHTQDTRLTKLRHIHLIPVFSPATLVTRQHRINILQQLVLLPLIHCSRNNPSRLSGRSRGPNRFTAGCLGWSVPVDCPTLRSFAAWISAATNGSGKFKKLQLALKFRIE